MKCHLLAEALYLKVTSLNGSFTPCEVGCTSNVYFQVSATQKQGYRELFNKLSTENVEGIEMRTIVKKIAEESHCITKTLLNLPASCDVNH